MPFLSPTDRLAEDDAGVLHAVVSVHMKISVYLKRKIKEAVPRKGVQHVVKEADAGGKLCLPGAVQRKAEVNVGFAGRPADLCNSF